jgi:uncharacterized SAM-dependent methyltransferase
MKHVNAKLIGLSTSMLYFKNPELAKMHHVTLRTVLNWIEAAKQGKLDLTLHTEKNKSYIANTARNTAAIKQLVEERRKYRNTRAVKVVTPRPEFYKLYTEAQVYDIVTDLEVHHEIQRQYNYFDGGAGNWDKYAQRLAKEKELNLLTATVALVDKNLHYIDDLLLKYKRINVLDIGVGNALPVRPLLEHLVENNRLGRYAALDISAEMLKIAKNNISTWFNGQVEFESYELDINYDRFANILAEEYLGEEDTANIVLVLGGTLCNLRKPDGALRTIHDSMGVHDYLIHTQKLDTETSRRYFDFNSTPGKTTLASNHRLIFNLLNIDESLYDVEMGYNEQERVRYISIKLKVALKIKFSFTVGERTLEFNKGESILLWRYIQQSSLDVINQLDRNDFYMLHSSQTEDQEYILTVSRVKCE